MALYSPLGIPGTYGSFIFSQDKPEMLTKYTNYIVFLWKKQIQFSPSEDKETRHNIQDTVGTRKCYHIKTRPFKFNPVDI